MESICLGGFCRVTDSGFKTILHSCSTLYKLRILLLDGSDITDAGLSYLREGVIGSLVSLSIRGCKRLTDKCISALFDPSSKQELQELDLSNLPNLSDNGIFSLAKSRVPILELRMRQCPLIGDSSIMALASMQVDDHRSHGSSLRVLDLYNCGGITSLSFRWLKNPYFPRLRWLGVTGSVNRDMVDALARSRPFLHVACHGEELGTDHWDGLYMHDNEEMDELEQWLLEGGDESDDEEMEEVENNGEIVEEREGRSAMAFTTALSLPSAARLHHRLPNRSSLNLPRTIRCTSPSISVSPSKSMQFDLRSYWTTLISEINTKLEEAIPVKYPQQIYEAMRYSVLAKGGKRAPPVMCVAVCELFGGDRLAAFPTACALEMVHAASLIHDDLPCMDDDPSRRGQPSNHTVYGVDMAILAGDALFPLGFRHIVSHTPSHLVPEGQLIRVIAEIARSVGSTGMAAGQFLDLEGAPNSVDFVQRKKFGEMAECSAVCGGFLGGAADDDILRLRRYGRAVGMLYQVVDDKAMEVAEELRAKAKRELSGFDKYGDSVVPLYSFVDFAAERGFTIDTSIGRERMANSEAAGGALEQLPAALLATIMTKLDVSSIRSLASTCTTIRSCASQIFHFLPNFHLLDVALSINLLRPLLPPNPYLRSLKVDCSKLDDSSIEHLVRPSLHEISLLNCADFSGRLLSLIGGQCKDLRSLYLGCVAEKRGRAVHISNLEELLCGCTELKTLSLMFDISLFPRYNFARAWSLASENLTSLEIGYVSSVMVTELLSPNVGPHQPPNHLQPSILPSLQRLCLSVDYITDTMVETVSKCLINLTHLDLRDAPIIEPRVTFDLTNSGFQQINQRGKLKHLSLVRSQEFLITYFKRVNDLGILLMADRCSSMESICLGGFCRVTDSGFKTILHSCSTLYKLRILLLDGSDITDAGLSYLREGVIGSLVSLSIRGCKRLTDKCISALFDPSSKQELQELDLSNLPNLSDNGIFSLAKSRVPILELRMRQCPLIGDTSIMALASMQVDDHRSHGSSLRVLDLYNCGGITSLSFRWLKNPYFPRLRWLGVTGSVNRDMVDALARSRPFLHVACHGEELGTDHWDGLYMHDNEEMDELEQWLLEGGDESDDEEMEEVENNGEMTLLQTVSAWFSDLNLHQKALLTVLLQICWAIRPRHSCPHHRVYSCQRRPLS
ncbi:unnamed protein product, partial [Vitis vinifera]